MGRFGPRPWLDPHAPTSTPSHAGVHAPRPQVIRHQIRTEYKVQFPYLYTSRPRAVCIASECTQNRRSDHPRHREMETTRADVLKPLLQSVSSTQVALAPYHHPPLYYVKPDDPDLPAFYFDPVCVGVLVSVSRGRGWSLFDFGPVRTASGPRDRGTPRNGSKSIKRPPTASSPGDDARRWRKAQERSFTQAL